VSGQLHTLAALLQAKRPQYLLDRRLGGLQSQSECSGGEEKSHHCPCWELNTDHSACSLVSVYYQCSGIIISKEYSNHYTSFCGVIINSSLSAYQTLLFCKLQENYMKHELLDLEVSHNLDTICSLYKSVRVQVYAMVISISKRIIASSGTIYLTSVAMYLKSSCFSYVYKMYLMLTNVSII
jgi:hypothetical protein